MSALQRRPSVVRNVRQEHGRWWRIGAAVALALISIDAGAGEWSGFLASEIRHFPQAALFPEQHDGNASLVTEVEYRHSWDDGRQLLAVVPFGRIDQHDDERTHADLRELLWTRIGDGHELRLGVGKVFWGVTEFQHLVDIINQTDLVENSDGEEKLGQPMINASWQRSWGTLNAYILPGFRERTFPGGEGRLRAFPPVDPDRSEFASSEGRQHVDWAVRWSYFGGVWDIGLYRFEGTSREPELIPAIDDGRPVLIPFYEQIEQTGLDVQATVGAWLWKLEAIHRSRDDSSFTAATGGFEYTFVGAFGSQADVGLVLELMRDERGRQTPNFFQDDAGAGLRIALNDAQSTQLLLGLIRDHDTTTRVWTLEASRRLGAKWKLTIEGRVFRDVASSDVLFGLRKDSYVELGLARYF